LAVATARRAKIRQGKSDRSLAKSLDPTGLSAHWQVWLRWSSYSAEFRSPDGLGKSTLCQFHRSNRSTCTKLSCNGTRKVRWSKLNWCSYQS